MRISAIIQIAQQYFLLGIIGVVIIIGVFLIGYFLIYKKIMKGTKKLNAGKVGLWSIFLIYIIIVLGATIGTRSSGWFGGVNLHLFSSYKDAWNSFSLGEWRNLIFNILMFVPLGFMLPFLFKKCEKWYITYFVGFVATLFIEILQFISKRGIFELDDIVNNTLGCIIGYGIVMILSLNFRKKDKKKGLIILSYQIPLIITIISFAVIFISYSKQELGNLQINSSYKIDMSTIDVRTKLKMDDKFKKAYIYKTPIGTKDEAINLANGIFSNLNTKIDEPQNDEYDETIVFKSENGDYSLWVNYKGFTTWYTDFTKLESRGKEKLTYEEVKDLLSKFNIDLPKKGTFTDNGKGAYTISFDLVKSGDVYLDGQLTCTIDENNVVTSFNNDIINYEPYKEYEILSLEEAYNKILKGEFKAYGMLPENSKMEITGVNLNYILDSKGFYQPVYDFTVKCDGDLNNIFISALKIN